MTEMDMSQYLGAFLDEAGDNLQRLDDLLLQLEKSTTNMEVINEIFRSAHTLKGMSATMGFEKMAGLTHALEDRLDAARKGTHHLVDSDMNLMFSSLDTMQAMVDSIREGGDDAHLDVSELVSSLRNMDAPSPAATKPAAPAAKEENPPDESLTQQEEEWVEEAGTMGMQVFRVHVTLSETCLLKAARAYMVVNRLEEMGDVIKTEPSVESLENEDFELDFTVVLASQQNLDEVKNAIARISDVADVEIEELQQDHETVRAAPSTPQSAAASSAAPKHDAAPASAAPAAAVRRPAAQVPPAGPSKDSKKANQTVRVDIGRLDKLMNLVGELVIGRARIERLVQEARLREFDEPLSQLGRISGDIQELVTKLRMVPVSFTFERFPRLIRDLSKSLGKEIEL
ncbi:MAG: Hpt domain-containing protein, partial [Synergistaceae bacterium]|nr:Hpt domain-containing protein [Synergistaceae bacterium]